VGLSLSLSKGVSDSGSICLPRWHRGNALLDIEVVRQHIPALFLLLPLSRIERQAVLYDLLHNAEDRHAGRFAEALQEVVLVYPSVEPGDLGPLFT
jgi:hypothetical protein